MASSRYNTSHAISSTKGVFFMTYDEAFALLRKYNSEPFHITHALTVSNVMRRMANELGYGDEARFLGDCRSAARHRL